LGARPAGRSGGRSALAFAKHANANPAVNGRVNRIVMRTAVLTILSLAFLTVAAYAQNRLSDSPRLYAVVFGVVIGENGDLKSFRVVKVFDSQSGSTDAIDVKVPPAYVSAARAQLMKKRPKATLEDGKPKEMFTYLFFDPKQPTRADIDPRAGQQ
jgi:hypothetical protein